MVRSFEPWTERTRPKSLTWLVVRDPDTRLNLWSNGYVWGKMDKAVAIGYNYDSTVIRLLFRRRITVKWQSNHVECESIGVESKTNRSQIDVLTHRFKAFKHKAKQWVSLSVSWFIVQWSTTGCKGCTNNTNIHPHSPQKYGAMFRPHTLIMARAFCVVLYSAADDLCRYCHHPVPAGLRRLCMSRLLHHSRLRGAAAAPQAARGKQCVTSVCFRLQCRCVSPRVMHG